MLTSLNIREREATKIQSKLDKHEILINLNPPLNKAVYDVPLTLKTFVPDEWKWVGIINGKHIQRIKVLREDNESFVIYSTVRDQITLVKE